MTKTKKISKKKANKTNTFRIMKLITFFLIVGISVCSAANSYSQTARLTLKLNDKTIKEVFSQIEKKSEFIFFYYDGAIDVNKKVSINVENQPVNKVLDELLKTTNSTYTISDRQIYISKKASPEPAGASQNPAKKITGIVKDITNQPLIGVTVLIKGTTIAVITDADGRFDISIPGLISEPTLVFKYVGFEEKEVVPAGKSELIVTLEEKSSDLSEVVVVGYGTQKKTSVVGSVQTVRPGELKVPSTSLSNSFAGRLAGVIAVQRTAEPGADGSNFWIRGVSTTSSGAQGALIIIDGVQASKGDLDNLAPEMIESFSVLKDATATSLYGTLGANGVLIVNTKSGVTEGKPIINLRIEQNFNTPVNTPKTVGGLEYMQLYNEAFRYRQTGSGSLYSDQKIAGTAGGWDKLIFPNVDWYDELFKDLSMSQNVNFNVRGGGQKADYYLGVNVSHENGMLKNRSKDFYSFDNGINLWKYVFQNNVNVRLTPSSKIYLRLNVQLRDYQGPQRGMNEIFQAVMRSNPVDFPVYYPAGDPRQTSGLNPDHVMWGGLGNGDEGINPVAYMANGYKSDFQSTVIATLGFEQKLNFITPGLMVNGLVSFKNWTKSASNRGFEGKGYNTYNLINYMMGANNAVDSYNIGQVNDPITPVLQVAKDNGGDRTVYIQGQLNYDRTFESVHSVQAMLLYNQTEYNSNVLDDKDLIKSLPQRKQGIAGRLSYAFAQKYLMELNFGYNGSDNFAKGHRWGFFPSVAVGYNISEEAYFEPLKSAITNLKIRGSLGKVGNDGGQGRYLYLADVDLSNKGYTTGINMDYSKSGPNYKRYGNENITWEVGTKLNLGIDLQLFNDWNIMLDVFSEKRKNIFMKRATIPTFLGTAGSEIWGNLGEVENKGLDFALNYDKQINKDLFISARGTFTFARNKITKSDESIYKLYPGTSQIGHQINQHKVLLADRLFIDWADIANSPYQGNVYPGDIRYIDQADFYGNYDGRINDNDKVYEGFPTIPEIVYGFGLSSQYKKFDMSVFFQGTARTSLLMKDFHPFGTAGDRSKFNVLDWVAESRWDPNNPDPYASYPALSLISNSNTTRESTYWLRDASFLKLRSVEIGYTNKFYRIYVSGNNLLTLSKFKHWDPEQGGGSGFKYPNQRVFNVGIQMNF